MISLASLDVSEAIELFAIANTPRFLARRLTQLSVVERASKFSANELLADIEMFSARCPTTLQEQVIPYVGLAALAKKSAKAALLMAEGYKISDFRWYYDLCGIFVRSIRTTSVASIVAHPKLIVSSGEGERPSNIPPANYSTINGLPIVSNSAPVVRAKTSIIVLN